MNALPRWVLAHPHAVLAALVAVLLLGLDARLQLPVQLFPDTDPPMVTVMTPYRGMAAERVEENLSKRLEEEFAGIDGVRGIRSTSQEGLSVVEVEFQYGHSSATGAVDVQNAINRIRGQLPASIGEPEVQEFSSADRPIVTLALHGDTASLPALRDLAENRVRDRLNLVPGVAAVDVIGGQRNQLEVQLHRDRLQAHAVDEQRIVELLQAWNLTEAGGRVQRGARESVVLFDSPLADPDDAGALVLARSGDRLLRLDDVADIRLAPGEQRNAYRYNGQPAIAVQVLKRAEANTVEVADRLFAALDELRTGHPDVEFSIAEDDSEFTRVVIASMTSTVLAAIALTVLVVLLFLGDLRQAAIVAATIPIAFLATFALMQLAGLQLDMVTMSAIILAIGLLVDDSIVVLENIHRHLEQGLGSAGAAVRGAGEVLQAKVGGTITTLAVLVPLTFLGGFIGQLFRPLSLTLIFALSASLVTALTVVPLIASLWFRGSRGPGPLRWLADPISHATDGLRDVYLGLLVHGMRHPLFTLGMVLVALGASLGLLRVGGSEMLPRFDSGSFRVLLDQVPGTPLETSLLTIAEVEHVLLGEPSVISVSTRVGYEPGVRYLGGRGAMDTHQAELSVELLPRNRRVEDQWTIMNRVRSQVQDMPGITLGVFQEQGGTARPTTSAPVVVELSGPDTATLDALAAEIAGRLGRVSGIRDPYLNWAFDRPEVRVTIDRERAAEYGLNGTGVARAVHRALDGWTVTPYRRADARDLDIAVRYASADRRHWEDLREIVLTGPDGAVARLGDIARMDQRIAPRLISRRDFQRTLEVRAWVSGLRPLSHVVAEVEAVLGDMQLPRGYEARTLGEQEDMGEARFRLLRALMLSAVAVYLLLMVQFRSLLHPLVLMAAVPLQFIGVSAALLLAGKYLSMPALLGVILLIGIVVNNSIILLDFALGRIREGELPAPAIRDAVATRFRPVLMTAISTVVGMLPLALELAVGSERFSPIATVIIGGVLASTVLTLVIVPVLMGLVLRVRPG